MLALSLLIHISCSARGADGRRDTRASVLDPRTPHASALDAVHFSGAHYRFAGPGEAAQVHARDT